MNIKEQMEQLDRKIEMKTYFAKYHKTKAAWYLEMGDYKNSIYEADLSLGLCNEVSALLEEQKKLNQKNT